MKRMSKVKMDPGGEIKKAKKEPSTVKKLPKRNFDGFFRTSVEFDEDGTKKLINRITTDLDLEMLDIQDIVHRGGFCALPKCMQGFNKLRNHVKSKHMGLKGGRPVIREIQANTDLDAINLENIITGVGHCYYTKKCVGRYDRLRVHVGTVHFGYKKTEIPKNKELIRRIEEGTDLSTINLTDIVQSNGYCGLETCKRKIKRLQDHIERHDEIVAFEERQKNLIREITEEMDLITIDLDNIITKDGKCLKPECNNETFTHLRHHVEGFHLHLYGTKELIRVISSQTDTSTLVVEDIITREGSCMIPGCEDKFYNLRMHFVHAHLGLCRESVPQSKPTIFKIEDSDDLRTMDVKKITTTYGTCDKTGCNKNLARLRYHVQNYHFHLHAGRHRAIIRVIKEEDDLLKIKLEDISPGLGRCLQKGCGKDFPNLRAHIESKDHLDIQKGTVPIVITVINAEDDLDTMPIKNITAGEGYCYLDGCNKKCEKLWLHVEKDHLERESKWRCPKCSAEVRKDSKYKHLATHGGPMKCPECPMISVSMGACKKHISSMHTGSDAQPLILSDEEAVAYWTAEQERREKSLQKNPTSSTKIKEFRTKLKAYRKKLKDPNDPFHARAENLNRTFESFYDYPNDVLIVRHATHVAVHNVDIKGSESVFEIIEKREKGKQLYSGDDFAIDDQLAKQTQPTNKDYRKSGYHRGHLVAAANFTDELLVASTYQYSNVMPMTPALNLGPKSDLERHHRGMALLFGDIQSFHFSIMKGDVVTIGELKDIHVPGGFGTVSIYKKKDRLHIVAWELYNIPDYYDFNLCKRDPFVLLEQNGIPFKMNPDDYIIDF